MELPTYLYDHGDMLEVKTNPLTYTTETMMLLGLLKNSITFCVSYRNYNACIITFCSPENS